MTEVDALLTRAQREIDAGLLPACQIAIARHGELEVFETYGDATDDTRFVVFSATKAFVAAAFWTVIADGLVDEHQLVVDFIPEFGTNGKEQITVEQVMLHTSGFPYAPLGPPQQWTRAKDGSRIGPVAAELGARFHLRVPPGSAHWVLAEIIDRVTGRTTAT